MTYEIKVLRSRIDELETENESKAQYIERLERQLKPPIFFDNRVGLSASETTLVRGLYVRPILTHEGAQCLLYGPPYEDRSEKTISIFIHKLRKKLKPYNVKVETVKGQGWCIDRASKSILEELILK